MNLLKMSFWLKRNARTCGSVFIFFSIIFLLGLPYSNWGFYGDDFGNVLNFQIHGLQDLINFIKAGNVAHLFYPSNFVVPPTHFFNVLYRPMVFLIFGLLSLIFGTNAQAYFLTIILIHAINSVCLFNIFYYFVDYWWALLGAMLFAFHPTLFGWFGWIAALPYQIDIVVITIIFFLLKKFIETKSTRIIAVLGLIYFLALFVRETLIVLPALIATALMLVARPKQLNKKLISTISVFAAGAIFYLLIRLYFFPFQKTLFHGEFIPRIWNGIFTKLFCYVYALPGLYVFFQNCFYCKIAITIMFLGILIFLFAYNTQKKFLLFLLFCTGALSWCQVYNYSNRYLHVAIPFFILFVLVDINYFKSRWTRINYYVPKALWLFLCLALVQSIFFVKNDLTARELRTIRINTAFDTLVQNPRLANKIIYFIDIPMNYFLSGIAQAVWLRGCNVGLPIYSYEVGLDGNSLECLTAGSNKQALRDIFKNKLAPLEALHTTNKKSCWIFWNNKNYKFFEVDFYENGIY